MCLCLALKDAETKGIISMVNSEATSLHVGSDDFRQHLHACAVHYSYAYDNAKVRLQACIACRQSNHEIADEVLESTAA
eukprot:1138932-Pelagomonas_calceolata.AAC.2